MANRSTASSFLPTPVIGSNAMIICFRAIFHLKSGTDTNYSDVKVARMPIIPT